MSLELLKGESLSRLANTFTDIRNGELTHGTNAFSALDMISGPLPGRRSVILQLAVFW